MNLDFQKNLGNTDRIIRAIIGVVLLAMVVLKVVTGWLATLAIVFSIFQFFEAIISY